MSDPWRDFLADLAQDPAVPGALTARNFLLDEGVLPERWTSYANAGAVAAHASYDAWDMTHRNYLEREVFHESDDDGPPDLLDPAVPADIPETFRYIGPGSPFLGTAQNVHLVRLEELNFVADLAGEDRDDLKRLMQEVLANNRPPAVRRLNKILQEWFRETDQRPVFATFWQDVDDLFGGDPAQDTPDWADVLRDRLGLAHLCPRLRPTPDIDVVTFRYTVKMLPRIAGTGGKRRPLVPPTVLDGGLSEAFCPSPRGATTGHVVNLDPKSGKLRQEVLHPRFVFQVPHLWRLGKIQGKVDRSTLPDARAVHLLLIRDATGRDDYAEATDGDIL